MQEFTIHVPDNKMALFLEMAHTLGVEVDRPMSAGVLSAEQIRLVEIERKKIISDPSSFLDWEEARKALKLD